MTEAEKSQPVARAIDSERPSRFSWPSVLLSALLLGVAVVWSDPGEVARQLAGVDPSWLGPAFLVGCVQLVLLGLRWSRISRSLGVELGFARATVEYALSVAVNLVLPSGFAGDGLRAYRHSRLAPSPGALRIVEALTLDRISGQMALGLVVIAGMPFGVTRDILDVHWLGMGLLLLFGAFGLALFVAKRTPRLRRIAEALARLLARAAHVLFAPRNLLWHVPLSLLFTAASVTQLYIATRALGLSLEIAELFWAGPLILLAASLPSFFGGWGVREGASGLLFLAMKLEPSSGVAVSVVYGVFGLVVHLPGLLVLLLDPAPRATTMREESHR